MTEITCVLPVYNSEWWLEEAILSVTEQEFTDWELIIVEDGSTDGSLAIAEEAKRNDSRIRVFRYEENQGLPAALNMGFSVAKGNYYTWTSADNAYYSEAFKVLHEEITRTGADVVYAAEEFYDENGKFLKAFNAAPIDNLLFYNVVHACFLYRRTPQRYRNDMRLAEDWEFWLRGWAAGWKFQPLPYVLYRYRFHPDSLTVEKRKACLDAADRAFEEHVRDLPVSMFDRIQARTFRRKERLRRMIFGDVIY